MKKFFFLLSLFFIFFINSSTSQISKYFGSKNLDLNEAGVINFIRYLEGTFYAEDVVFKRVVHMSPMYYAISEDGKVGYGWFCRSLIGGHDCADRFIAYRLVEYCKEYSHMKCSIFAMNKEIVWNNLNIKLEDFSYNEVVNVLKKNNFYKINLNLESNVNQSNYLNYVNLKTDKCHNNKIKDYSNFRGADLNCLLPGRYEINFNDEGRED